MLYEPFKKSSLYQTAECLHFESDSFESVLLDSVISAILMFSFIILFVLYMYWILSLSSKFLAVCSSMIVI